MLKLVDKDTLGVFFADRQDEDDDYVLASDMTGRFEPAPPK